MYLSYSQKTITDFTEASVEELYNDGFVFTRRGYGEMDQTRSVRIDLSKFKLSSENRRVLRKTENIELKTTSLPHPNYDWTIHKLGHEFYTKKFGDKTFALNHPAGSGSVFSANKIKELLTDKTKSNFNLLLQYSICHPELHAMPHGCRVSGPLANNGMLKQIQHDNAITGYAICFQTKNILHYSYPFYDLTVDAPNLGIGMMTKAVVWAQENNKKYVYLGSAKDDKALYKFQFSGAEWFDGNEWINDVEKLKTLTKR